MLPIINVLGSEGRRGKPNLLYCLCISTCILKYLHPHFLLKMAVKGAK